MTEGAIVATMIILLVLISTVFGATLLLSYMVLRMLRSAGWDKSNITNALRALSHIVMHPEDLQYMWYVKPDFDNKNLIPSRRPFYYIDKDEISEVVATRPLFSERLMKK